MQFIRICALLLAALFICQPAWAQDKAKSFAVLPFKVLGPEKFAYLGPAIQTMLVSRLSWPGRLAPVDKARLDAAGAAQPASLTDGLSAVKNLGVDYLIWGTVSVVGDDASLDVQVVDKDGKNWPKSTSTRMSELIPRMENLAQEMNAEIFKRPGAQASGGATTAGQGQRNPVQMANPELIYNEQDARQDFFLNPYFKYQANPDQSGRWKSQTLPIVASSMVIDDLDGDGENEIALVEDGNAYIYAVRAGKLDKIASCELPPRMRILRVNSYELGIGSRKNLIVTGYNEVFEQGSTQEGSPWSGVLAYENGKLRMVVDRIPMFVNVIQSPPAFKGRLICQKKGGHTPLTGSVHEVVRNGNSMEPGMRIPLPAYANVFNFGYMPTPEGEMILVADDYDRIRINQASGTFISQTGEEYVNSPVGFGFGKKVAGLGVSSKAEEVRYWVPMRMFQAKLTDKNRYELIVGRNISVAANIFANFRDFPYGEIHSLYWDGVGLSLIWKTRRLKGTIVDYAVADIDNDGIDELCILMHSYAGTAGSGMRRSLIEAYKLILDAKPEGLKPELESEEKAAN